MNYYSKGNVSLKIITHVRYPKFKKITFKPPSSLGMTSNALTYRIKLIRMKDIKEIRDGNIRAPNAITKTKFISKVL